MRENRLKRLRHAIRKDKSEAVRMVIEMNIERRRGRERPKEVVECD